MLICNNCGKVIANDEIKYFLEEHGEKSQDMCYCGGDFVEAKKCTVCGEWIPDDYYSVCNVCMEEYETTKIALEIGERDTKQIIINGYVAYMFTVEEINTILKEHVLKHCADDSKKVVDFCEADKTWFLDFIVEKERRKE